LRFEIWGLLLVSFFLVFYVEFVFILFDGASKCAIENASEACIPWLALSSQYESKVLVWLL